MFSGKKAWFSTEGEGSCQGPKFSTASLRSVSKRQHCESETEIKFLEETSSAGRASTRL